MKYLLPLIIILTLSTNIYAKKNIYPIEVVACMADIIVVGEITNVYSDSYDLKIRRTIKGQEKTIITVQMFQEWTYDTRKRKAEKGQELFLFLVKNKDKYEIINGSTGEMFIEKNKVLRVVNDKQPTVDELAMAINIFTRSYKLKEKGIIEKGFFLLIKLSLSKLKLTLK